MTKAPDPGSIVPGEPIPEKAKRTKPRKTTSKQWIEQGPLAPWMHAYGQWLAEQPEAVLSRKNAPVGYRRGPPKMSQRTAAANRLARRKISARLVTVLEQRQDFSDYFEKLRADAQYLAKELLRQDIGANIEARREGLGAARVANDHKAIKGYTDWVTDIAFPKKVETEHAQPRITINIGAGNAETKALLSRVLGAEDEVQDVEFEVIETRQLESGDE